MAITDWPAGERPREKLLQRGAGALSDAELLAIFLRTGVAGKSAVDLARELLVHFGSLRGLLSASQKDFCGALGLGAAKYCQLQAVLEMASRHTAEALTQACVLDNAALVKRLAKSRLGCFEHEVFAVFFLDSQHQLVSFEVLFRGSLTSASVHPREIVKRALTLNAGAVILAHNHPSGVATPSDSDRDITQTVMSALALIDVRVLDHIVVGASEPFSFCEHGMI
ncbi:MAG TPA: DNA repair protein RadC [Marinagarivorans sp.]